jgi:hypothetical protein
MKRQVVAARVLGLVQAGIGAGMVAAPVAVAGRVGGPVAPAPVVRVLGVRGVGQGLLTAARPGRATLTLGAVVDLAHLASMVALAAASPRWRRSAAASGAVAVASAVAGLALVRAFPAR